jgi:hypothetical protein
MCAAVSAAVVTQQAMPEGGVAKTTQQALPWVLAGRLAAVLAAVLGAVWAAVMTDLNLNNLTI